jgi:APA family basic amino acid/polyamine antiporter
MTVIGIWKLRRKEPEALRLKGFPVTQIIYAGAGILILILSFLERPIESSIALLTVLVGIPAYLVFSRNKDK